MFDCLADNSPYYESLEYQNTERLRITRKKPGQSQNVTNENDSESKSFLKSEGEGTGEHSNYFEKLNPYYQITNSSDETLVFESRFESGNLWKAL